MLCSLVPPDGALLLRKPINLLISPDAFVNTIRVRLQIQAAEISFLRKVDGVCLSDRVSSSVIEEQFRIEPLLLHIESRRLGRFYAHHVACVVVSGDNFHITSCVARHNLRAASAGRAPLDQPAAY